MGYNTVAFILTTHKIGTLIAVFLKSLSFGRAAMWTGRRKEQPPYPVQRNQ
jgi:hypothetical protein